MLRHSLFRILLLAACLAALSVGDRAAAGVPPDTDKIQDVTGSWSGYFQSTVDPRVMGTVQFDVATQRQRRFMGTVTMRAGVAFTFPFDGTIAASGDVNGGGRSADGTVHFHGQLIEQPIGSNDRVQDAAVVDVQYRFTFPDGSVDEGFALALRSFPEGDCTPPDVTGTWTGSFTSASTGATGEDISAWSGPGDRVSHTFTGGTILSLGDERLTFVDRGTIDCPDEDGAANVVVIGVGATSRVIFQGVYMIDPRTTKPCIKGTYVLEFFDGTTDRGTFEIEQQPLVVGR